MRITEKLRKKSAAPADFSPVKIAFLGDSVTHGCFELIDRGEMGFECVYDQNAVYHTLLKSRIETIFSNCPVTVINAGISGGNAEGGAQRVQRDVISASPDLCVVCFGLNDVLSPKGIQWYLDSLDSIFSQLENADIETVFMTPGMVCTYKMPCLCGDAFLNRMGDECSTVQNNGTIDEFMRAAKELCARRNIPVCDCYGKWKKLYSYGVDVTGLLTNHINHPIREMHGLFADSLFDLIFELNNI